MLTASEAKFWEKLGRKFGQVGQALLSKELIYLDLGDLVLYNQAFKNLDFAGEAKAIVD